MDHLPRVDVIIITHRHLDHFDVQSLAALPKHAEVLCPNDSLIVQTARSLGFREVVPLDEWQEVRYPGLSLTATRSENRVPELGFIVLADGAVVWNQVDTEVSSDVIAKARAAYGSVDLLIAPWQPLLEMKYQTNRSVSFPHAAYSDMLGFIREAGAPRVVPGACGFRYAGSGDWLNHVAFPVSRGRFARDVVAACLPADVQLIEVDPGDVLHLHSGKCRADSRAAGWVGSASGESERVWYCPVDPFGDLVDSRQKPVSAGAELNAWARDFDKFLKSGIQAGAPELMPYVRTGATFQLLVCSSTSYVAYRWNMGSGATMSEGLDPAADVVTLIDEALLLKLDAGELNWEYKRPNDGEIVDPLMLRYPYADAMNRDIERQSRQWGRAA
jgi:hypothetical protein